MYHELHAKTEEESKGWYEALVSVMKDPMRTNPIIAVDQGAAAASDGDSTSTSTSTSSTGQEETNDEGKEQPKHDGSLPSNDMGVWESESVTVDGEGTLGVNLAYDEGSSCYVIVSLDPDGLLAKTGKVKVLDFLMSINKVKLPAQSDDAINSTLESVERPLLLDCICHRPNANGNNIVVSVGSSSSNSIQIHGNTQTTKDAAVNPSDEEPEKPKPKLKPNPYSPKNYTSTRRKSEVIETTTERA